MNNTLISEQTQLKNVEQQCDFGKNNKVRNIEAKKTATFQQLFLQLTIGNLI